MTKAGIGIDVGGTTTKLAFVTPQGRTLRAIEIPTRYGRSPGEFVARVSSILRLTESELKLNVAGVGLALAGDVDARSGVLRFAPNLPSWSGFNFRQAFMKRLRRRVVVENDANSAVWGGYVMELGRRPRNVLGVTLGTGVGGGLVLEGRLYRGATGSAGEVGHLKVETPGDPCHCGQRGCLEAYAGSYGIVRTAKRLLKSSRRKSLLRGVPLDPESIAAAAGRGDALAREVWERTGRYLGKGLLDLVMVLNPDVILILGGVSKAGRLLLDPIHEVLRANPFRTPARRVLVRAARHHNWGCVGAALLSLEEEQA